MVTESSGVATQVLQQIAAALQAAEDRLDSSRQGDTSAVEREIDEALQALVAASRSSGVEAGGTSRLAIRADENLVAARLSLERLPESSENRVFLLQDAVFHALRACHQLEAAEADMLLETRETDRLRNDHQFLSG